ncbi:hypothetical protein NHX12_014614 [Muraenolepis orangiensis]|uniref:Doublecortin domain-containing protein n=1 Tax=Muraenolepis orangiensis TaxID=630683 RepID=A0A9Q0DAP6_9TELE|nr:hypothetical protein NHX12_014614 [Muraenolepis orangiensis]
MHHSAPGGEASVPHPPSSLSSPRHEAPPPALASPPPRPRPRLRPPASRVTSAPPTKRLTFYRSGDSQFGGVKMAVHRRSFKCFDALLDDLSQKVPLPFGVRTVTTPRGTHAIQRLDQLQDGACYLCSDRRHRATPVDMELAAPEEASDAMRFHVRRLYTAEGRRIDSVQSLRMCPGLLVCVGREPFSPMPLDPAPSSGAPLLVEPLPPRGARSPPRGARSRGSQCSEGRESGKNVNFGLETKKSIIHPRSDSSTRSTRLSLSSENGFPPCSHSHARPTIMNDDIEKRVLVNKDGSLSVEMKVRFRLHSEETLRWSTQIRKSPSLTDDCCLSREDPARYLRQGPSETCSDPDSGSCDPETADMYGNTSLQHPLEAKPLPLHPP